MKRKFQLGLLKGYGIKMIRNRKVWKMAVCMSLCVTLLGGCSSQTPKDKEQQQEGENQLQIICTSFPQYDWTREILGEKIDEISLKLLFDNGEDLHNFQPSTQDIAEISKSDLFVYIGGESDAWVEDVLSEAKNKDLLSLSLMDTLGDGVKEEEFIEGMEGVHDHDHIEDHEDELTQDKQALGDETHEIEQGQEAAEYDEHIWLSLKNTKIMVEAITEAVKIIDPENAGLYDKNSKEYIKKLDALDLQYEETISNAKGDTLLFGDRFPFRYLVEDYNLKYYAAFVGCSAETEASFQTITFLAQKLDELNLPAILVLEGSSTRLADTISSSTISKNQEILVMNSLQSVSSQDMEKGYHYLQVMEDNLKVIEKALQ